MTVGELIKELQKHDEAKEIIMTLDSPYTHNEIIDVDHNPVAGKLSING